MQSCTNGIYDPERTEHFVNDMLDIVQEMEEWTCVAEQVRCSVPLRIHH